MSLLAGATAIEPCLLDQALPFKKSHSKPLPSSGPSSQHSISPVVGNGVPLAVRGTLVGSTLRSSGTPTLCRLGRNNGEQHTSCTDKALHLGTGGAQQQRASFRVSTRAARGQSPTLIRPPPPKHSSDDVSLWDAPLEYEEGFFRRGGVTSSSDDGWGGRGRKREGRGPLPWYSKDLAFGGLVDTAPLNAVSGVSTRHGPTVDERDWVELHTATPPFLGRKVDPWLEFGDYDLDEARADFRTLKGLLQGLRVGQTKSGHQRGSVKAHKEGGLVGGRTERKSKGVQVETLREGGLGGVPKGKAGVSGSMGSLRVDRLNEERLEGSFELAGRGATSLRTGRPDAKPESLLAAMSSETSCAEGAAREDVFEALAGYRTGSRPVPSGSRTGSRPGPSGARTGSSPGLSGGSGGQNGRSVKGGEKTSEGSASTSDRKETGSGREWRNGSARPREQLFLTGVKEFGVNGLKTLAAIKAGREAGQDESGANGFQDGDVSSLEAVRALRTGAVAEATVESRGGSSDGDVKQHHGTGRYSLGNGHAFPGVEARASVTGQVAPGTVPRAVEHLPQQGFERVAEANGASFPGAGNEDNKSSRAEGHRLTDSGGAVLADERPSDGEDRRLREGENGRHVAGSVSNGRTERGVRGAWRTRELSRGQWVVKVVTPVRKFKEGRLGRVDFPAHSSEGGPLRVEALSGPKTALFGSHGLEPLAATGPDREVADEVAVAEVVSAVTSLLRTGGSVTFGRLEGVLEPWVGKISQRSWDRVFEVFEVEIEPEGVLAVLGWMVGRHSGTEPDFERALSTSGAALSEDGRFGIGSAVAGAEALDRGSGSQSAFDEVRETTAEETGERGGGFEHSEILNLGGGERIRIDARVLDGVLGDQACSCRVCASLRAGPSLAADGLYEFGGVEGAANETPDWVWRENDSEQAGGSATGQTNPPKTRKKKLSLITRDACVTAVRALAAAGRLSDAAAFLPLLDGTIAGQNLRKALIMQLARDGKADEALVLLRSCAQRGVLLYNVVMDACSKAWLGHERVVALFDRMVSDGLRPTVRSCNIVLSALVRENMLPEASRWMDEMRVMGCKPDAVSYNTLLGARVQFKAAREVFDQMCREGVAPNLRTFNVLIAALAAVGDYQEAMTWLQRMKGMRIEPSEVTYNSLITACLNGGSGLDEALSVVDMMEEAGFSPDVVTFNILIGACSRFGWLEEREDLLVEMTAAGIPANHITRKMIALHRPDDLERGFRKRFEVQSVEERQVIVVEKRNRRPRGPLRRTSQ